VLVISIAARSSTGGDLMATGVISFPGIFDPQHMIATRWLGAKPSAAIINATPQSTSPDTSGTSTLQFGFDGTVITWTGCLCDRGSMIIGPQGQRQVFTILDRRWLWRKAYITRAYNVRYPDGTIDTATSATLAQIATDLFTAMGEPSADVSAITSTEEPPVVYDHSNCSDAIEELLNSRGYVISLQINNTVKVFVKGTGETLPNNYDVVNVNFALDPPEIPDELQAVGSKTVVQSKLFMEPVGLDTDGRIRAVASLSYAPGGGWAGVDFETFDFISDPLSKECAKRSVGKWYQVSTQADGSYDIDGYNPDLFAVTSAWQYLPLDDVILSTSLDVFGKKRRDPAFVEGTFYDSDAQANPPKGTNTSAFTRVDRRDWQLDKELGIVKFKDLVLKKTPGPVSGSLTFADVYLTCSYSVHDNDTFVKDKYVRARSLGGLGVDVKEVPGLQRQLIVEYTPGTGTPSSVDDNLTTVDADADLFLDSAVNQYATEVGNLIHYRGIYPFSTDGVALQVKWDVAVPTEFVPFGTRVSQYHEGIPLLPTERELELLRRNNQAKSATVIGVERYEESQRDVRRG